MVSNEHTVRIGSSQKVIDGKSIDLTTNLVTENASTAIPSSGNFLKASNDNSEGADGPQAHGSIRLDREDLEGIVKVEAFAWEHARRASSHDS